MESTTATNQVDVALAERLRSRRLELRLSQVSLAAELGVDQSFVSRVELGERSLTFGQALKWLNFLYPNEEELISILQSLGPSHVLYGQSFWDLEENQK